MKNKTYSIDELQEHLRMIWVNYNAYCLGTDDELDKTRAIMRILENNKLIKEVLK